MSNTDIKSKSIKGTLWSGLDSIARQIVSFIVNIVLARLLVPADFGLIGMLSLFISLSNVFIECGFSNALIRKTDRTQADCSTAFYFNIIVGLAAYLILVVISPVVAEFYGTPILKPLLCIIGLNVLINSLCIVQNALLTADFNIKIQAKIQFVSQVTTGIIAIVLAYFEMGVWALAFQSVGSTFMRAVLLWIKAHWKPTLEFSKDSFAYLWGFGSKMLATGLISSFFNEINSVIIGKNYTKSDLGFYTRANQFARLLPDIFIQVIQKVTIPTLAQYQNDKNRLKEVYIKYIEIICMICLPAMFLLSCLAEPLVLIVLSEKWRQTIIFLQMLSIGLSLGPIGYINLSLLQVLNRTDLTLKLEIIKKIILALVVVWGATTNLFNLVLGFAAYNAFSVVINMYVSKYLIDYQYKEQATDILKYLIPSIVSACIVFYLIGLFDVLIMQLIVGGIVFSICILSIYAGFKYNSFNYLMSIIKTRKK